MVKLVKVIDLHSLCMMYHALILASNSLGSCDMFAFEVAILYEYVQVSILSVYIMMLENAVENLSMYECRLHILAASVQRRQTRQWQAQSKGSERTNRKR